MFLALETRHMLLTDFREISRAVCASVFVSLCVRTQELTQTSTAPEVVLSRIFRHYEIIVCCIMCRASDSVFMTAECRAPDYLFRIAVCRESDFADYKSVPVRNCSWGFTFWGLLGFNLLGRRWGAMGWLRLVGSLKL